MYWDIFDEMRRMQKEFDRAFGLPAERNLPAPREEFRPAVADCYETENSVISCFEIPGADKDDIELNITDDYIEVTVEKETEHKEEKEGIKTYSVGRSQFYRRQALPANVDPNKAKASYKNGVLRVEVPKDKESKKRKIKIE